MSSYIFIDSLKRDVYKYPNSADFVIGGNQTENWNLIRSITPALPVQRSKDQYYNVKVCTLTLPMTPELLEHPGIFLSISEDNNTKTKLINHILTVDHSGFPCTGAYEPRSLETIAICKNKEVSELTVQEIKEERKWDSRQFHKNSHLNRTSFYMVCDKLQFNEEGKAKWIHYKSCMDQIMPLNLRGNAVRFSLCDVNGKLLEFTTLTDAQCNGGDLWDPCEEKAPGDLTKQVYAVLEVTYLPHKESRNRLDSNVQITKDI